MKLLILLIWLLQPDMIPGEFGPTTKVCPTIEDAAIEAYQATRYPPFNGRYRTELWEIDLKDGTVRKVEIPATKFVKQ
jgi:hypothetical protein